MKLLFGHSEKLLPIAEDMLKDVAPYGLEGGRAVGVVTGDSANDSLYAVAIFTEYNPVFNTCAISFASFTPKWATRGIIKQILEIPFEQFGTKKLWASTTIDNEKSMKLLKGIGFKREATLVNQYGPKRHAVVYRMMEEDFRKKYLDIKDK